MSRAFACDDPTALAEYRRVTAALKQWRLDFTAACKELGSDGGYATISRDGIFVIGLQHFSPAAPGWRWTPSRKCMRPAQGADGAPAREWLKSWAGHKSGDARLSQKFGMPTYSHSKAGPDGVSWMHRTQATVAGEQLLVLCDFDEVERHNADLWREIKLSEYHAAIEAAGAEAGA